LPVHLVRMNKERLRGRREREREKEGRRVER
jgi:hypothetical protein